MYGCESWTIKKAECWRIDAFELWCWRRLLRVSWTARRSNQSILKEISPEYSLEGLMLKLKLQYFGHLMRRTNSLEKTLMLGKIEGRSRRGQQRMRWLDGITDVMNMSLIWWWTGKPGMLQSMGSQRVGHDWAAELNWDRQHACVLSHFNHVQLFGTPSTVAHQVSLSTGVSRQEHCSGFPCPPPGELIHPGIEHTSLASSALQADSLLLSHQGSPDRQRTVTQMIKLLKLNMLYGLEEAVNQLVS